MTFFNLCSEGEMGLKSRLSYLLYSTLLFAFFSITQPYDDLYRAFYFVGILPAALLLIYRQNGGAKLRYDYAFWLMSLLLISIYISAYWSDPPLSGKALWRYTRWFFITFIFATAMHLYGKHRLNKSSVHCFALQLTTMVAAIVAMVVYFLESRFPQRLVGPGLLDHPILGASVLVMLWGLSLFGLKFKKIKNIVIALVSLISVTFFVFLTQSRGPIIATFVLWLGILYLASGLKVKCLISLIVGLSLAGAVSYFELYEFIYRLIDRGDSYRLDIWASLLANISEFFWLGIGAATKLSSTPLGNMANDAVGILVAHPHNLLLSVWVYSGIIPLCFLVALLCFIFVRALKLKGNERIVTLTVLLTVLALSSTDTHKLITSPQEIWMIFWLPIGILSGYLSSLPRVKPGQL